MVKVSVCIPTYNRKDYLVETLDSIFSQTYRDFEIIIVDDGSTDGTGEMIEQADFPVEVRYHWQKNAGDAVARNTLTRLARGEYISFIDSDDLLVPDALERMVAVMEAEPDDVIVYGSYLGIDENGKIVKKSKRKLYSGDVTKYLFLDILIHSCGSMFPKKVIACEKPFDTSLRVCSDYSMWLDLSLKYKFCALNKPTFKRRRHNSNLSNTSVDNRLTEFRVLERFYYDQGGDRVVPVEIANKRFAKEEYRVGKAAFAERDYGMACEYFSLSFKRKMNLKTFLRWTVSLIAKKHRHENVKSVDKLYSICQNMKLLVITNNPNRASFRQRIGVYVDQFRDKGVTVDVEKLPSNQLLRFRLFKKCASYDAIFLQKKRLNPVDAKVFAHYAGKVIYDFDDAIMYDDKRSGRVGGKRERDFARTVKLSDVVLAGNQYLANHAAKFSGNVHVLPTGLNINNYQVHPVRKDDGKVRLVWIGSRSTLMYLEGIRDALEEVGRRFDNVVLRIICDTFFELENMDVEKIPWSLDRQGQCLCESDIGLAPLPDNEFTRGKCGFKILQYAAANLPVVASGVGVNREFAKDGVRGFLADSPSQWIEKVSELIENKDLRSKMGDVGRKWVKKFDLTVIGKTASEIVLEQDKVS